MGTGARPVHNSSLWTQTHPKIEGLISTLFLWAGLKGADGSCFQKDCKHTNTAQNLITNIQARLNLTNVNNILYYWFQGSLFHAIFLKENFMELKPPFYFSSVATSHLSFPEKTAFRISYMTFPCIILSFWYLCYRHKLYKSAIFLKKLFILYWNIVH